MIEERIQKIEATIETSGKLPPETKAELLSLVAGLKAEVSRLSETHHEEASSITRYAEGSVHEAAREENDPERSDSALEGLRSSIAGLEESHPALVGAVNRFATALSNMGL